MLCCPMPQSSSSVQTTKRYHYRSIVTADGYQRRQQKNNAQQHHQYSQTFPKQQGRCSLLVGGCVRRCTQIGMWLMQGCKRIPQPLRSGKEDKIYNNLPPRVPVLRRPRMNGLRHPFLSQREHDGSSLLGQGRQVDLHKYKRKQSIYKVYGIKEDENEINSSFPCLAEEDKIDLSFIWPRRVSRLTQLQKKNPQGLRGQK